MPWQTASPCQFTSSFPSLFSLAASLLVSCSLSSSFVFSSWFSSLLGLPRREPEKQRIFQLWPATTTYGKPMTKYVCYYWHHVTLTGIKELRKAKHSSHLTTLCIKQDLQKTQNHINTRNKAVVDNPQHSHALSKQKWSWYYNCKGASISNCKSHGTFNSH